MASNARERSALSDAVAAEIRAERARAKMLQAEVAEAAGLAPSTYLRLEAGERVADVSQLRRLAAVFGTTTATMLTNAEANVNASGEVGQVDSTAAQKGKARSVRARTVKGKKSTPEAPITKSSSP